MRDPQQSTTLVTSRPNGLVMTWVPAASADGRVRMEARWSAAADLLAKSNSHAA